MSKLVAYFSASGVTAKLARKVAVELGAELFEIRPETPYTKKDLNWMNFRSRSSVEMKNKSFRPPVAADCRVENMAEVDAIFLGFPIWWYVAPTIINTFLEQYDLAGKKIVLFATSGSSGMGNTMAELKPSAPGAEFIAEKRFPGKAGEADVKVWLETLNI